jgi:predicted RNase H-like HicB family nuclease
MSIKIIVEKHADGYVAYATGLKGIVVGEGDTLKAALADVKSAIKFHQETFGGTENWVDEKEHDRLFFEYKEAQAHKDAIEHAADIRMFRGDPADPEDCMEVNEETKRDIEEAIAEFKAGRFRTAEEVYKELGVTEKKNVK